MHSTRNKGTFFLQGVGREVVFLKALVHWKAGVIKWSFLCLKVRRVPAFLLISGTMKYSYWGKRFCPCFYQLCWYHLQPIPRQLPSLPVCWPWTEKIVPSHTLLANQLTAFSAEHMSHTLFSLTNRNPEQAQSSPLLYILTNVCGITHWGDGGGEGILFIWLFHKQNWELLNKQKSELLLRQTNLMFSSWAGL